MKLNRVFKKYFRRNAFVILILILLFGICGGQLSAADSSVPRKTIDFNSNWLFYAADVSDASQINANVSRWEKVNLPHTWNVADAFDDMLGYRMGVGWYRKELKLSELVSLDGDWRRKKIFLNFEAVGQKAEVFVNGQKAGVHEGGYTAFHVEITRFLHTDATKAQIIAVKADNSPDPFLAPPSSADFNLYGGIYRDVFLTATETTHFSFADFGSSGVYVDTPQASGEKAVVRVRGTIIGNTGLPYTVRVVSTVSDARGQAVGEIQREVQANVQAAVFEQKLEIFKPHLWSPEAPYLYTVKTALYRGDTLIDEVISPFGVRWFSFDPNRGFFLNGNSYKLRGTNRHQDYQGMGNALPNELHAKDLEIIKENGFNMVLLPHYPHDPKVLEAADRIGLFVWAELPLIRQISTSPKYAENARQMLRELIRQQYNHPSIIIWCYMNEIFLRPLNESGYTVKTVALARELEEIARAEDPFRYTAVSANRPYDGSDVYHASGLMQIPKIVAWHMYFGWYYGNFKDFGLFLDAQHRRFPKQNIFVSEFGADYDTRLHSLNPTIGDGTAEWARNYHESYLEQIEARPFLAGSGVWAQFEFGSEARSDSRPGINTKGIYTFDRRPKDIAFLYRAYLSQKPVLHIAATDWSKRIASVDSSDKNGKTAVHPITVYTNLPQVELFVNKRSAGIKEVGSIRKAVWDIALQDGINLLEVRGKYNGQEINARTQIRMILRPEPLTADFLRRYGLLIDAGSKSQFIDEKENIWEADREYRSGSWGFAGGKTSRSLQNITETADDPLYQTFREGLFGYRFDAPDGEYEIELRFAENASESEERAFNILVNGAILSDNFSPRREAGNSRAVVKIFRFRAKGGKGISLDFKARTGEPILSAVRLRLLSK